MLEKSDCRVKSFEERTKDFSTRCCQVIIYKIWITPKQARLKYPVAWTHFVVRVHLVELLSRIVLKENEILLHSFVCMYVLWYRLILSGSDVHTQMWTVMAF
jgi:hypothetical protein